MARDERDLDLGADKVADRDVGLALGRPEELLEGLVLAREHREVVQGQPLGGAP